MRKIPENRHSKSSRAMRVCRVAYTLDNNQPVLCTIIGDQPLFYMDYEGGLENEFAGEELGDLDIAAIENGIENLQQKILGTSTFSMMDDELPRNMQRLDQFAGEVRMATLPREPGEEYLHEEIDALCETLRISRMAAALLDFAHGHKVALAYSTQISTAAYDRDAATIYINPHLPRAERMLLAVRELRRVWQHRNGALLHPLTFHPDQAILVNRAQMADLSVFMVRIAWEWQLAGEKDPWETVESGDLADLARALARECFADFRTLNNGVAASAVFEAWFLSERCRNEDRKLIQHMLADYQGYVFDGQSSSQAVTADLIGALGSAPFGKNYLAPYVATIMGDALFTDVRDRSNANFLWFIKFERSFREAEQDLQSDKGTNGGASATDRSHKKRIGDEHEEARIIPLPHGGERPRIDEGAPRRTGSNGAQIISFQRNTAKP